MHTSRAFEHFVLTRFDVNLGDQSKYRTDEWFDNRLDLFERFTCPSIASQTEQNFTWVVFFHEKSRETVERRFGKHPELYTPIFTSALWEPAVVRDALRSLSAPESGLIVSTQLDCDDVYAPDTIERIQRAIADRAVEQPAYFNFPLGYQYCDGRFYIAMDPANPFITLAEPVTTLDDAVFAYHVCHEDASEYAPVTQIDWTPGWLQVVHGKNIMNHTNGLRIGNKKPWSRFHHIPGIGARVPETRLEVETDRLGTARYLAYKALFKPAGRLRIYRALKIDGPVAKVRDATAKVMGKSPSTPTEEAGHDEGHTSVSEPDSANPVA